MREAAPGWQFNAEGMVGIMSELRKVNLEAFKEASNQTTILIVTTNNIRFLAIHSGHKKVIITDNPLMVLHAQKEWYIIFVRNNRKIRKDFVMAKMSLLRSYINNRNI